MSSSTEGEYLAMYNLYRSKIHLMKNYIYYIEIYHYFDQNKLQITKNPNFQRKIQFE